MKEKIKNEKRKTQNEKWKLCPEDRSLNAYGV